MELGLLLNSYKSYIDHWNIVIHIFECGKGSKDR